VIVRHAREQDVDEVLELVAALGRPAVAADPRPQQAGVLAHLAHPDGTIFVVDGDRELAGCASLWIRPRLCWTTPEAWLPDLYVRPAYRRRGVARALLDACAAEATRRGCHELRLESGTSRVEAHALYEAYGFERFAAAYRLTLPPSSRGR
jgi:aminoglycoside 6'-N-acetyltransferase I